MQKVEYGKNFHLAPLIGPSRRFLTVDKKVLQEIYATNTYQLGREKPEKLQDVFKLTSPRKNHELGASLQTDGIQLICRWEKDVQRTITVSKAKHEEYEKKKAEKKKFLAQYEEQQKRRAVT